MCIYIYVYIYSIYSIYVYLYNLVMLWLLAYDIQFWISFEFSQLFRIQHALACTNDYECMCASLEVLVAYNTNFIWLQTFWACTDPFRPVPSPEGCSMRASCSACMAVSTGSCERLWKCDSQIPTDLSGWFHPPQLLPRCPVDASASHGVSFHPSPDSTFDGVCRCSRTDSPSNQWDIQQLLQQKVKIKTTSTVEAFGNKSYKNMIYSTITWDAFQTLLHSSSSVRL